ncbi:MAG: hypothetical protein JXQ72_11370, partial [Anaerolineae bacterium]|nr:hypothetical protein [Anaerolineae bacterium]
MTPFTRLILIALFFLTLGVGISSAQGDDPPTPTPDPGWTPTLTILAPDGQPLAGDLYLLGAQQPTVILLHQLYADRTQWGDLPGSLLAAGFNVLAVDVRGHGLTGGDIRWDLAVEDVGVWIGWARSMGIQGAIST